MNIENFTFTKAERKKAKLKLNLNGPSGSGKTSLLLNFIKLINVWDKVILLAKDLNEPLYQYLIQTYEKIEKKFKCEQMACGNFISQYIFFVVYWG